MKIIALLLLISFGIIILAILNSSKRAVQETTHTKPTATHSVGLANPASENCVKKGGEVKIMTNGAGAQFGLCQFEDDMACEEWALMRGDCPVGGVKTTGYDNVAEMYCAWVGGETLAVSNPNCKLPDGTTCTDEALYNGTCPPTI